LVVWSVDLPDLSSLIRGLKSSLEELKNDPINTLLQDSPNADEGTFNFYFVVGNCLGEVFEQIIQKQLINSMRYK
jgi:hypothetical protein